DAQAPRRAARPGAPRAARTRAHGRAPAPRSHAAPHDRGGARGPPAMMPGLADSSIVRLALRRPITMLMVLASAIVLGFVPLARTPLGLIPSGFSPPFLSVSVPYPDATARDIEEKITQPLETAVSTTPGIDEITSISSAGNARIMMIFQPE